MLERALTFVLLTFAMLSCSCTKPDESWKQNSEFEAEVVLPSLFSDNMILQRNAEVVIWGTALAEGDVVHVLPSWAKTASEAIVGKGRKWKTTITTPDAGGPYSISFYDNGCSTINNIMIGDVWFCSGQSNMEMPLPGFQGQPPVDSQADIAEASADVPIRMFLVDNIDGAWKRQYANSPQEKIIGSWQLNTPDKVRNSSCIAYYFAKLLQKEIDIPVGIIVSSLGGSKIQSWMSEEAASGFPEIKVDEMKEAVLNDSNHYNYPCVLYNAKIAPFLCLPIKGMIWYQGESNSGEYKAYPSYQKAFVNDLRAKWNCGEFPFYFVQIAPYSNGNSSGLDWARFRECQSKSANEITNSGMVCIMDLGDENNIHPVRKKEVAQRLVNYALGQSYGKSDLIYKSPELKSTEVRDGSVTINVATTSTIAGQGSTAAGFEIAGADGKFYQADAMISTAKTIVVSCDKVKEPKMLRYCYRNYIEATVFDRTGLPLVPFNVSL